MEHERRWYRDHSPFLSCGRRGSFYVVHLMRYIFDVTADASHGVILSGISK